MEQRWDRRRRHRPMLSAWLASAILLACEAPSGGVGPTVTETPAIASPTRPVAIEVARVLRRAPKGCPGPVPQRRKIAPHLAPLIGNRVAAAGFYARFEPPDMLHSADAPRKRFGYRVKVLWVMPSRQPRRVRVEGRGRAGELWFDLGEEPGPPSTTLVMDPGVDTTTPSVEHPRWREFPSYVYFPAAGCYVLRASWGDGVWSVGIGFGR